MKLRQIEIESKAYQKITNVLAGSKTEDSTLEFKRKWPTEFPRAARQIAALCNAAPGEDAAWVIGFDEDAGTFHPQTDEISVWKAQASKFFDGPSPIDRVYTGDYEGNPLTILHFDTTPRPFVVAAITGRDADKEIPWRAGNSTRSAYRTEVLKLLVPAITLPNFEVLYAGIFIEIDGSYINAVINVYIIPSSEAPVVMPIHKCALRLQMGHRFYHFPPATLAWKFYDDEWMEGRPNQLIFREPSFFGVRGRYHFDGTATPSVGSALTLTLQCGFASSDTSVVLSSDLPPFNTAPPLRSHKGIEHWTCL